MDNVASLKIAVNTSDIKTANDDLNKLTKTSSGAEKATSGITSSFISLNKVLAIGSIAAVAAQYIKLADTMKGIQSKLKLVTSSAEELATTQAELFKISQATRQGFAETVDTYSNFAVAMGEMGKSQKEILRVTETVNKAIAISGGTAQQAAAATMQLGQAFASGTLRGDELNSILENSKGLAKAIADGMGVPIGKLRTLGSEGKITAEILASALEKSAQSVDDKFGKVGVTVAMSVTQIENSLLQLVGEADKAMNGSGGLSETFTYFSQAMDNNRAEIIEGGRDAYRALQVMGVGVIQFGTSFYQTLVSIPTAIALAIDISTQSIENGINAMIGLAEDGTNKIKSLYGGDRVKLGRVDIDTNLSSGLLNHYDAIVASQKNAISTQANLFRDIMADTTELQKITPPSDKAGSKKTGTNELTKEQIAAVKKAEKLREEEAKIQRGYLEGYSDLQANAALEEYNVKLGYEESYREIVAQEAIAQYEMELGHIEDLANRQSESALAFYEMTRSEQDKINEENLALYEANVGLFNDEQMQSFFTRWQESIEGVKGGYSDVQNIVSSFVEDSLNSKDWTAGLTGTAKSVANLGNAFKDLDKQNKKYEKARKEIAKSTVTDEKKSIANKEIENAQYYAQIDAYSTLAGAAAGFFEQGSSMAKAMAVIQGGLAIVSAGAGGDPYTVIPRMIAAAAMVAQTLSASGISGGSGASAPAENYEQNKTNIENSYAPMTDRLDRQIELLESIDKNGSASQLNVSLAATSFQRDYALWVEDTLESMKSFNWILQDYGTAVSNIDLLEATAGVDAFTTNLVEASGWYIAGSTANQDILRENLNLLNLLQAAKTLQWNLFSSNQNLINPNDIAGLKMIDVALNEVQNFISEWAMGVVDSMDDLKDASKDFKGYFDDITGSMYYESLRLQQAYSEVDMLRGNRSFAEYLQETISNMDALDKFFTDETFALLMSENVNDIQKQIEAINKLSSVTGETFAGGAKDALNYLESIKLVSDSMKETSDNVDDLFGNIKSFIDDINNNKVADPSKTFISFSESFNNMLDAISSGSKDMVEIGSKTIENAKNYLDVVTSTATAGRDIEFAKAILINKFSGVIATPDTTLSTINDTLRFSLGESGVIASQLQELKDQIRYLNDLNTTNTSTNLKILSTQRSILGETAMA